MRIRVGERVGGNYEEELKGLSKKELIEELLKKEKRLAYEKRQVGLERDQWDW